MSNIRVDLEATVINGQDLIFKSPTDCSQITGLIVYYPEGETTTSKTFQFVDAHGNDVGSVSLFAEDVLVKVILDTDLNRAYVQNADTNAYLEAKFNNLTAADVGARPDTWLPTLEEIGAQKAGGYLGRIILSCAGATYDKVVDYWDSIGSGSAFAIYLNSSSYPYGGVAFGYKWSAGYGGFIFMHYGGSSTGGTRQFVNMYNGTAYVNEI